MCNACVWMAVLMRGCGCLRAWVRGWTLVLSAAVSAAGPVHACCHPAICCGWDYAAVIHATCSR